MAQARHSHRNIGITYYRTDLPHMGRRASLKQHDIGESRYHKIAQYLKV